MMLLLTPGTPIDKLPSDKPIGGDNLLPELDKLQPCFCQSANPRRPGGESVPGHGAKGMV